MWMKRHSQVLKHDFKFRLFVHWPSLRCLWPPDPTSHDLHKQCGGVYLRIQWNWHYLDIISQDSSTIQYVTHCLTRMNMHDTVTTSYMSDSYWPCFAWGYYNKRLVGGLVKSPYCICYAPRYAVPKPNSMVSPKTG